MGVDGDKDKKDAQNQGWWVSQLAVFAKLSVWIASPIVAATFIGKWLDGKFGTEPFIFLSCVGLSFLVSIIVLIKKAGEEINKINK